MDVCLSWQIMRATQLQERRREGLGLERNAEGLVLVGGRLVDSKGTLIL